MGNVTSVFVDVPARSYEVNCITLDQRTGVDWTQLDNSNSKAINEDNVDNVSENDGANFSIIRLFRFFRLYIG